MAGNTRGKIKEHLEGVHRNFDWVQFHIDATLVLIQEHKPNLSDGLAALGEATKSIDEKVQAVYSQI